MAQRTLNITSIQDFFALMAKDTPLAFHLAKSFPHIAKLISLQPFAAICRSPAIGKDYARDLLEIAVVGEIIKNQNDFSLACKANTHLSDLLLADKRFKTFADDYRHYATFDKLAGLDGIANTHEQKRQLKRPSLFALDLATPHHARAAQKAAPRPTSKLPALLLDDHKLLAKKTLAKHLPSYKSFMEKMMYAKSGYYSKGKVEFTKEKDFDTYASDSRVRNGLAMALANQLFALHKKLITDNNLRLEDDFNILECGAGNGDLCAAILRCIASMAKKNQEWQHLNAKIKYHIVEKSPALVKRQKKSTAEFQERVTVIRADARHMTPQLLGKPMAAVFSNELLDAFGAHILTLSDEGVYMPECINFVLTETLIKDYFMRFDPTISMERLKINSLAIVEGYGALGIPAPRLPSNPKDPIYLSEDDFCRLNAFVPTGKHIFGIVVKPARGFVDYTQYQS